MIGVNHYSITEDALNNRLNDDAIYYVSEANRDSDVIEDENKVKHISVGALSQTGEYEQIKIYDNKDGTYSITATILSVQ